MLKRSANDACSWWWASHLRTKQSKWLEQDIQDMEVKVQDVLNLIDEDGDSFAKRAEMYYKKRPELFLFVEESFRSYRALAERYDHLSKDLQSANHTLVTICPEKFKFVVDNDDECSSPGFAMNSEVPRFNKAAVKYLKKLTANGSDQSPSHKNSKVVESNEIAERSGLSKSEAVEEIDKLHKEVLILSTAREFVKTSYESGIAKYWGIENQVMEMQQKISKLQDEFNIGTTIEEAEARTLMAETALKSCEESLIQSQEKLEKYSQEAQEEYEKIEDASHRLMSLRQEYHNEGTEEKVPIESDKQINTGNELESSNQEADGRILEQDEVQEIPEKNEPVDPGSTESKTVVELTDKIDELVNKVVGLETAMSSQTVLIIKLRTEASDLHVQIRAMEKERESLINGSHNMGSRVKELEERLAMIQEVNKKMEDENNNLHTIFVEVHPSVDFLSKKLTNVEPDEVHKVTGPLQENHELVVKEVLVEDMENQKELPSPCHSDDRLSVSEKQDGDIVDQSVETFDGNHQTDYKKPTKKTVTFLDPKPEDKFSKEHSTRGHEIVQNESLGNEAKKQDLNWQLMLLDGLDDREKILLTEYTTVLRSYKDTRRKLIDMENRDRDAQFETKMQIRGMKSVIAKKDAENRKLCQKLNLLLEKLCENDETQLNDDANLSIPGEDDKIKFVFIDKDPAISVFEEKLQTDINALQNDNLEFWLRFSTAYQQIKKFKTEAQDLRDAVLKLEATKKEEGTITKDVRPEVRTLYNHLREVQKELTVWVEQNAMLNDELNRKFESLYNVEDEIRKALEGSDEEDIILRSYRTAKFRGEILSMKQEYKKMEEELQAGFDHVSAFQLESEMTLRKLNDEFQISGDEPQQQPRYSANQPRIPLRVFIFGAKPKKNRCSIFACIRPYRKFQAPRGGISKKNR